MADRRETLRSPGPEPLLGWPSGKGGPLRVIITQAGGDPRGADEPGRTRADEWFSNLRFSVRGFPRLQHRPGKTGDPGRNGNEELKRDALQVGRSAIEGGVDGAVNAPPGERWQGALEGGLSRAAGNAGAVAGRNFLPTKGPQTAAQEEAADLATNALGDVLQKGIEMGSKRFRGSNDGPPPAAKTLPPTRADDSGLPDRRYWSEAEAQVRQFNEVSAQVEAMERAARSRGAYASGPEIEALRYRQMAIANSMKAATLQRDQAAQPPVDRRGR